MSNQRELLAQATAARLIQDRLRFVAIIELCSIEIRAKDKILGSVAPMLTPAAFGEIFGAQEAQDKRIATATAVFADLAEPPASITPETSQKTEPPNPSKS